MEGTLVAVGVLAVVVFYCCIKKGAKEERRIQKMKWREERNADAKSRQPNKGQGKICAG